MGFLNSVISSIERTSPKTRGPFTSAPWWITSSTSKPTRTNPLLISSADSDEGMSTNSLIQDNGARIKDQLRIDE